MRPIDVLKAKIEAEWIPRIEASIRRTAEVLSDPNAPADAYAAVQYDLSRIQETAGADAARAYCAEVRRILRERLLLRGVSDEAVEDLVQNRLSKIANLAPQIANRAPQARRAAKWLKGAAIAAGLAVVGWVIKSGVDAGRSLNAGVENLTYQGELDRFREQVARASSLDVQVDVVSANVPQAVQVEIPPAVASASVQVMVPDAAPVAVPAAQVIAALPERVDQQKAVYFIQRGQEERRVVQFRTPAWPPARRSNLPTGFSGGPTFGSFSFSY